MSRVLTPELATRALSVKQPWADAILHGTKRCENRGWTSERFGLGWIWLHAPEQVDRAGQAWMEQRGLHKPSLGLPTGAIIGLVRVRRMERVDERADDPWAFGPWCWVIDKVIALEEPVPCKGSLSVWELSASVLARCLDELATLDLTELLKEEGG